jgi:hypothetical protein
MPSHSLVSFGIIIWEFRSGGKSRNSEGWKENKTRAQLSTETDVNVVAPNFPNFITRQLYVGTYDSEELK